MWEAILDALIDTAKVVPILLLVYLLISYLTHHKQNPYKILTEKSKYYGPLLGGLLGCVPQCGFSAVMADLYSKRAITLGTLMAVFLATSDEALPILIANPTWYKEMFIILGVKLLVGILFGYLIDFILQLFEHRTHRRQQLKEIRSEDILNNPEHSECEACESDHHHTETHHSCHDSCCADNIFLDAIIHTAKIVVWILLFNIIFGIIIYYVGMDRFVNAISIDKYLQPLMAGLIGLIPNCAGSVFLIELYMAGGITLSATIAGLSVGSGIGILILFKQNKNWKENLFILISLYIIGVVIGIALTPLL